MMRRYIVHVMTLEVPGLGEVDGVAIEKWIGLELDEVDVAEFSRETGYHLIPADHLSNDELASVGVTRFERFADE